MHVTYAQVVLRTSRALTGLFEIPDKYGVCVMKPGPSMQPISPKDCSGPIASAVGLEPTLEGSPVSTHLDITGQTLGILSTKKDKGLDHP